MAFHHSSRDNDYRFFIVFHLEVQKCVRIWKKRPGYRTGLTISGSKANKNGYDVINTIAIYLLLGQIADRMLIPARRPHIRETIPTLRMIGLAFFSLIAFSEGE